MRKILIIYLLIFQAAYASKINCNSLYTLGKQNLSNSPFFPLSVFLETEKNPYAVRSWLVKNGVASVGPGIAVMYRTANLAAEKVLSQLKIPKEEIYTFDKPTGNFLKDFEKVITIMRQRKYKYIQNPMILSPEGIYMVLPLAVYDPKLDTYTPYVIKGHQDLKKSDIMTAAISSDAIGLYMNGAAPKAIVHLRPMAPKRKTTNIDESIHTVVIKNEQAKIKEISEILYQEYREFNEILELQYAEYFSKNPHKTQEDFLKEAITPFLSPSHNHLTSMSYAPSAKQREALKNLGYPSKKEVAQIDLNSTEFLRISLLAKIAPYRLKSFINKSRATMLDTIIQVQEFENPFINTDHLVYFDIEFFNEPDIKSGSYLFGYAIQKTAHINKPLPQKDIHYIGGFRQRTQINVDKAWRDFLFMLKKSPKLQNGNYKIIVYSAAEQTKLNQLLNVKKDYPQNFTQEEKAATITIKGIEYPLYKEFDIYEPTPGLLGPTPQYRKKGYLIRRDDFFQTFPELNPHDAFNYFHKLFDGLPFARHTIASPGKNNGIKTLLPYLQQHLPPQSQRLEYGPGDNGLNCIAWIYDYMATGDKEILNRIKHYLGMDVRSMRVLVNFMVHLSQKPMNVENTWSEATLNTLKSMLPLFTRNTFITNLRQKQAHFLNLFKKSLSEFTDEEILKLIQILDRNQYLNFRKKVKEDRRYSKERKKALLAHKKHQYETQRKEHLLNFVKTINPDGLGQKVNATTQDALYFFLNLPSSQLAIGHINKLLLLEQLERKAATFIKLNDLIPLNHEDFDPLYLTNRLKSHDMEEVLKTLKKKNYRLLKFNKLDTDKANNTIKSKEYGLDETFEKYESVNMKAIWEGLILEYLLGGKNE